MDTDIIMIFLIALFVVNICEFLLIRILQDRVEVLENKDLLRK